ncbi:hypothetical protein BGZ94_001273, partial [Podila epigama]
MPPKRKATSSAKASPSKAVKTKASMTAKSSGNAIEDTEQTYPFFYPGRRPQPTTDSAESAIQNYACCSDSDWIRHPKAFHPLAPSNGYKNVFNANRCQAWFKTYTGLEEDEDFDTEQIGPGGIAKLCDDLGVSLAAVDMLVLAFHLQADTMPVFTKDEWMKGMAKLQVDSADALKKLMPQLVQKINDPQHFKEFYRYIFMFAKDSDQKCMAIDTAVGMLDTVLEGRPHIKKFLEFLEAKKPVKVINKDQWNSLLEFSDTIYEDFSNYDGISSAWPVLLD